MALYEQLFVDGLVVIISGDPASTLILEEVAFPPPKQRAEWISAADSEGAALMRSPQHENREITAKVRIGQQTTMDLAFDKIGQLLDKFAKAASTPGGVDLAWVPATSTRTATFDLLAGEIEEMPIGWGNGQGWGWMQRTPFLTIKMTCGPYWRGTETSVTTVTSTVPVFNVSVPSVAGDVPALGRLVVTDNATQNRRFVEWGSHSKTGTMPPYIIDSDSLVITGYTGTQTTATGAYDADATGNNIIQATVGPQPQAVCGTGNLAHVGTWRVRARVRTTGGDVGANTSSTRFRLAWRDGDGPTALNAWVIPPPAVVGAFVEIDLGVITVSEATAGTQRWSGRVDAYHILSTTYTAVVYVDYLLFIPTSDGYGKARTTLPVGGLEVLNGRDGFTGTTAGGALNARVAPAGGTWATSGEATDLVFSDALSSETVTRSAVTDTTDVGRVAILGATNYTSVETGVTAYLGVPLSTDVYFGAIARYTDASNYVRALVQVSAAYTKLAIITRVAATDTQLVLQNQAEPVPAYYRVRLVVYASGQAHAYFEMKTGETFSTVLTAVATSSVLATGGALATGKPGFHDAKVGGAYTRHYDDFYVGTPPAEQITVASGQSLEVRHDDVIREDSGGTVYGRPASYRGSRFLVQPAGTDAKTTDVVVHAHRNDLDTVEHTPLADSTQAQVFFTPRGLAVPR